MYDMLNVYTCIIANGMKFPVQLLWSMSMKCVCVQFFSMQAGCTTSRWWRWKRLTTSAIYTPSQLLLPPLCYPLSTTVYQLLPLPPSAPPTPPYQLLPLPPLASSSIFPLYQLLHPSLLPLNNMNCIAKITYIILISDCV